MKLATFSFSRTGAVLTALCLSLSLSACGAEDAEKPAADVTADSVSADESQNGGATDAAQGKARLVLTGESIDFDLRLCSVDETDVLAEGPGKGNEDDEIAYLGVDFVLKPEVKSVEARVDLGVNEPFKSSDRGYTYTSSLDQNHTLEIDGDSFTLEADFISFSGSPIGPGTLTVDCR